MCIRDSRGPAVFSGAGEPYERSDYLVLVVRGVGFFAADSRFALAAGVVGGLLALEAKHVFNCAVSFL